MTFWMGVLVGCGAGAFIATCCMLLVMGRAMGKKGHHDSNWKLQLEGQERQLTAIYAIAEAVREKS